MNDMTLIVCGGVAALAAILWWKGYIPIGVPATAKTADSRAAFRQVVRRIQSEAIDAAADRLAEELHKHAVDKVGAPFGVAPGTATVPTPATPPAPSVTA